MMLAHEYLSNIWGMISFRYIVSFFDEKNKFPILTKYLPTVNDGILPSQFAQQALDELLLLEEENATEEKVVLIEKSTGSIKASVNSDSDRRFAFAHNNHVYGINKYGFYILRYVEEKGEQIPYVMFRSKRFIQHTISKKLYKFIETLRGKSFECPIKLHPDEEEATDDYEFEVRTEHVRIISEYGYMIEPLKRLAKASIISGNPIHWT